MNSQTNPDEASRSPRCYRVRLIIDCDPVSDYLWFEIDLPFVPSKGQQIRLEDTNNAGWWHEPVIDCVEWVVPRGVFECPSHLNGDVTKQIFQWLTEYGWIEL